MQLLPSGCAHARYSGARPGSRTATPAGRGGYSGRRAIAFFISPAATSRIIAGICNRAGQTRWQIETQSPRWSLNKSSSAARRIAFAWTINVAWLNCARHGLPEGMVVNHVRGIRVGQDVRVKLVNLDPRNGFVDFELV